MKRSWLVQRLEKPRTARGPMADLADAFAFGGGLRNGGLSDEAMSLLKEIFTFDYMGAAEFEFGAVPNALNTMATTVLQASTFTIPLATVKPHWSQRKVVEHLNGDGTVFVLCLSGDEDEIEERIRTWAREGYGAHLKESTHLDSTLRPHDDHDGRTVGWLELDNGFMFFTDADMWRQTRTLFGVVAPEPVIA